MKLKAHPPINTPFHILIEKPQYARDTGVMLYPEFEFQGAFADLELARGFAQIQDAFHQDHNKSRVVIHDVSGEAPKPLSIFPPERGYTWCHLKASTWLSP